MKIYTIFHLNNVNCIDPFATRQHSKPLAIQSIDEPAIAGFHI